MDSANLVLNNLRQALFLCANANANANVMEIFLISIFFLPIDIYLCQYDTYGEKNPMVTLSSKCIIMCSVFLGQFQLEMELKKLYSKKTLNDFDYLWIVIYVFGVTAININQPAFPHVTYQLATEIYLCGTLSSIWIWNEWNHLADGCIYFSFGMASFWGWNHIEKLFLGIFKIPLTAVSISNN